MKKPFLWFLAFALPGLSGCGAKPANPAAEAPPAAQVEHVQEDVVAVDHPEQFSLTTAVEHSATSKLVVTGTVSPDVSRTVPVISLAAGRVVDIRARLGDSVKKGQLLMRVQSADISSAYSDYQQAVADETLAKAQFDRANDLYSHGAIAKSDLEVAKDAADKAEVTARTTAEHLQVLGSDVNHPSAIVDIYAPISGVITDQEVTNAAGIQGLSSPNPFTISDLSSVWILCDVYENDLAQVHVGENADIHVNAYPDRVFTGRIGNIGPVLDPNLHTSKVRIEVHNPGILQIGMFVTATFEGRKVETHAAVPASAIMHLHDRDWVFVPLGGNKFRRVAVVSGSMLPNNQQEIVSGLAAGQQVVANALVLENTVSQ